GPDLLGRGRRSVGRLLQPREQLRAKAGGLRSLRQRGPADWPLLDDFERSLAPRAVVTAARGLRVLIVEDRPDDEELVILELQNGGYEVRHERVETEGALVSALSRQAWDIILSDFAMPQFSAPAALAV